LGLKVDDKGDDENPRGLKSNMESSQCVCVKLICVWVLLICISWENTLITGNSEKQLQFVEFYKVDHVKGLLFYVKLVKQSVGSWSVLFSCFYVLSIWGVVSWILVYAIYLDSGVYVTKCNLGLGFLWNFNVFWGLCGLKKLRREGKPMGSEIREIWPFRNLKLLFVGEGKNLSGHSLWIRWPHAQASG